MTPEANETICCEEAVSLRITVPQKAKVGHRPLHEVIVEEARKRGLAGATVLRGVMSLDAKGEIRKAKILHLSEDLPLVIEIVDMPDRVGTFLRDMEGLLSEGLLTLRGVRRIVHRPEGDASRKAGKSLS